MNMKNLFVLMIVLFAFANVYSQTTLEEYNYLTKGYKVQIESGLDMKKGYEIEELDKTESGERTVTLYILNRIGSSKKEIAAYLVVYQKQGNPKEYICIPHYKSEQEVMAKFWSALYDGSNINSTERLQLILYQLTYAIKW